MIKAEELRIGNHIYIHMKSVPTAKIIHVVEATTIMMLTGEVEDKGMGFEPIPLTAERLLKFGAVSLAKLSDGYERFNLNGIQLSISPERDFFVEYVHQIPIKSVHALQNFYFATRQEELTLKSND